MSTTLPNGFSNLRDVYKAPKDSFHSVIGIVVDLLPLTQSRRGEHQLTFKLLDSQLRDSFVGSNGLKVRFFREDLRLIPQVKSLGDVVVLRSIKSCPFQGEPLLLGNRQTKTTVFPVDEIPKTAYQLNYAGAKKLTHISVPSNEQDVTPAEQMYAIALKSELADFLNASYRVVQLPPSVPNDPIGYPAHTAFEQPANAQNAASRKPDPPSNAPTGPRASLPVRPVFQEGPYKRVGSDLLPSPEAKRFRPSEGKLKLIEQLRPNDFADLLVQVVKKYQSPYGECELYVTDYTENKELWHYPPPEEDPDFEPRDGDVYGYSEQTKKGWPGPFGRRCLKIELKNPHAGFANDKVKDDSFVMLRNVRAKIDRNGTKLEANMWPDQLKPEHVGVTIISPKHAMVEQLMYRKASYWRGRPNNISVHDATALLSARDSSRVLTKKERKRLRKLEEGLGANKAPIIPPNENPRNETAAGPKQHKTNQHIRAWHTEIAVTGLREIIDAEYVRRTNTPPSGEPYRPPFVNANFRARARVLDFKPDSLEDFAYEAETEQEDDEYSAFLESSSAPRWQWYFSLLLESVAGPSKASGAERLWIHVGHEEAQYLFGNGMEDPAK